MITLVYGGEDPDTMPIDTAPNPHIGEDVHYVARGDTTGRFPPACRAAKVTETQPGTSTSRAEPGAVGLAVFNPTGLFFHPLDMGGVQQDPGRPEVSREHPGWRLCGGLCYGPGTWHRPHPAPMPQ